MSRIAILTDSTAALPAELLQRYNIHVIPLNITWDGETLQDGIDLTPAGFYSRLASSAALPTTSQPSSHAFLQVFQRLALDHIGIVAPLLSSGISGTVASALAAAAEFTEVPVEIIDTRSTAAGLALAVLAAARTARQGCDLPEVAHAARTAADNLKVYFAVDTLKYLHKGGRIGGASRFLGTMLGIKPLLFLNAEGKIDALEKVRTRKKALQRLAELAAESAAGRPVHVGLMHAGAAQEAAEFQAYLAQQVRCIDIHTFDLSPVIAAHAGPGTLGVALYAEGSQ